MKNKIDYMDMLKKVSPYNIKKGILYFGTMEPEASG